ncbi:MAG: TlpA family protein disulfide reductase [Ignavibacteria bacterium]|nr:TlpA family protein disulfide reductase [Ignavibacteria bacterium]
MYKLIILLFAVSLLSLDCSKKQDTTIKDKQKDNTQQNQQNNQSTQQNQSATSSYAVKSVSNAEKKNDMVDFTWEENGKEIKLSDYKGKVILINFWATWCPPCRKELPDLSQISTDYKDKDFKMIGVSIDDNQEVLNNFLKTNKLSYTVLYEPNELVAKYMTTTGQNQNVVPQSYLIDKNGKVVEAIIGSKSKADFISIINKYM